ncbi:MAG: NAD(P)/FAD-dependent oxidoreductase [Desulfobacterales bacterium]|nr:NAD(P)/FAD-dependent oxidoreductase [Desulfobacterales bacterium]
MAKAYDAIIVGGGHNGLTAAGYLGKAGFKTLVLEKRSMVGGAVVTEEIHPGYRLSTISYVVSLLRDEVTRDLELKKHGYSTIKTAGNLCICNDDYLFMTDDENHNRKEVGRFSSSDYDAMKKFDAMVQAAGSVIRKQMLMEAPKLNVGISDLISLGKMGLEVRKLSGENRHRLFQLFTTSAYDLIERWFESPMVKNMYASSSFSGNYASLKQPSSAIPFFHMAVGELDGELGAWRLVKGGMGGITQAMASFARSKGVEIRTEAPVKAFIIKNGRATGVLLENGETISARCLMANTDPKRTFLKLMDQKHLDSEFAKDIKQIRMGHSSLKLNLALKGLPDIRFFESGKEGPWHRSNISIFSDIKGMEENYFAAAVGKLPKEPRLEIVMPSTVDDTLAPPGHHVMSILAKYYPYELADNTSWDDIKEDVTDQIIDYLSKSMPNIRELIVGRNMISPLDLEREYGLTEADIFHGKHDLDQLFSFRPHPEAAQYRTPIKDLYLCGSGSHPGGGVTGAPGHNAARVVIADLKKKKRR